VSRAETDDPIMILSCGGTGNHLLHGSLNRLMRSGTLRGDILGHAVNILNVINDRAAVMWPLAAVKVAACQFVCCLCKYCFQSFEMS